MNATGTHQRLAGQLNGDYRPDPTMSLFARSDENANSWCQLSCIALADLEMTHCLPEPSASTRCNFRNNHIPPTAATTMTSGITATMYLMYG